MTFEFRTPWTAEQEGSFLVCGFAIGKHNGEWRVFVGFLNFIAYVIFD